GDLGRILCVVDNGCELRAAEAMSHQQFETEVVDVGRQVPGMIREYAPDVLVLDVALPHLNGVTVAGLLREDWPRLPIVLASENFDPADSPLPAMTEFLPKPYGVDALVRAI